MTVLQREDRLQQIVKLVGPDVLPDSQKLILFVADMLKDGFLAQSAFDDVDMYCTPERQMVLLGLIMTVYHRGRDLVQAGAPLAKIRQMGVISEIVRAKQQLGNDKMKELVELGKRVREEFDALDREFIKQG
jgi:V/A-type H+-transporting ATPase subunit A